MVNKEENLRKSNKLGINDAFRYARKILYKRKSMPEALIFFVTSKCNARCEHCFFWKDLNKSKDDLTIGEIKKISSKLGNFSHLFISGGEPFIRKDLPEIVETFYRNNHLKSLLIPTNGILTEKIKKDVDKICERNPELRLIIDFSLDNLNEKHDKIRGVPGIFNKLIKSIEEVKGLKKKHKNLNVGTICVFNSKNQDEIYKIYKFIKEEIRPDSVSFPLIRGDAKNKTYKEVDLGKYEEFCNFLKKEYEKHVFEGYNNFFLQDFSNFMNVKIREEAHKVAKLNKYRNPCYACNLIGVIYPNGDVNCCEILPTKIGNLREADYDLKKIWLSKNADKARKFIRKSKCFCTHECFMYVNLLFNSRSLASILGKYFLRNRI